MLITVIVSTVLVFDEIVCELTISPIGGPSVGEVPGLLLFANCGGGGGVGTSGGKPFRPVWCALG